MALCGVLAVALMTAVAMAAPLELWEIAALDELLDDAYAEAMTEKDSGNINKRSSWNCKHKSGVVVTWCDKRIITVKKGNGSIARRLS